MASAKKSPICAYLYVLGTPEGGPCKIGFSYVPNKRAKAMEREGYAGTHVVTEKPIQWALAKCAERYAHWLLRDHHLDREWFNVSREVAIEAVTKAVAPEMLKWYSEAPMIPVTHQPKTKILKGEYVYTKFPEGTRQRFRDLLGDAGHSDFVRAAVLQALDEAERTKPKPD